MKLIANLLAAVGLAVGMAGTAQAAINLVQNGGFETGQFLPEWTPIGNTTFNGVTCGAAPQGNCYAFFGPIGSLGGISQTLTTVAGQRYFVTFQINPDGGTPSEYSASFGGQTLVDVFNAPASAFRTLSFSALATGASTVLAFNFRDDPGFIGLDAVSVALPEPASLALLGLGLAGMGFVRRRKS